MAFLLYAIVLLTIVSGTALYLTRSRWLPLVPDVELPSFPGRDYLYSRLPSTFAGDMEAGLTSSNFDLADNVDSGDSRAGLDDAAKAEILKIMKRRRLKFDDARRAYMENRFKQNGIGPDGRPRDPKFVSFS